MSDKAFAGQHIVVTGGGTGIGRAAALAFADQGAARVTVVGRRAEPLAEVAAQHEAVVPLVADATTEAGVEAIAESVAAHGSLDVLVHNAGIFRPTPLDRLDAESVRGQLDVNVVAPVLLTGRLLPLLTSPGGSIVVVSSISAQRAEAVSSVYAATKAAVDSLVRSWAVELAPKGIRVNGVAPGAVETPILGVGGLTPEEVTAQRAGYAADAPAGRIGQVDDVVPWITRLAEPASAWVTGEIIVMDGGRLLV
ncbi:SDR family NAD(P)-dependent oxidoreductase [Nocardia mexicana]|uniref:NAD(P)-dependent dehydrogenase (Short-subunit alcohol dehydrogenase family) n=1 Tax=Nocardia mexicana TaxID=279262 RepID=A0A370GXP3_9NOCA|nr:SDR family oxidoreductase [Nocardia mexicana]RDI48361.1 NAD(P)-dependent dehydrogenase (short-subunit alcohol dehydrogenase family) [Nocardia mexicana]